MNSEKETMRNVLVGTVLLAFVQLAVAQDAPATKPDATGARPAKSREQTAREYAQLQQKLVALLQAKDYENGAEVCRKMIGLAPADFGSHYNLACCLARLGKKDEALEALAESVKAGWLDSAHMEKDEDLDSIRDEKKYAELLAAVKIKEEKTFAGEEIEGTKKLVGKPEGGLRYRLRMSGDATKDKPNRLIVWLHPSGGSMNEQVEAMSAMMAKNGWALLVLTQKNFMYWTDADAKALGKTLEAVGKIEGIDANRPILMGFSAGGQMALLLWADDPKRWGGLVLDAAYPIDAEAYRAGKSKLIDLPEDEAIKKCPFFVLVGLKDGGAGAWKEAQKKWPAAGIPLVVHYIPDKPHTWLFGKEQIGQFQKWLADVTAGKLPTDAPASAPATPALPAQPEKLQPQERMNPASAGDSFEQK